MREPTELERAEAPIVERVRQYLSDQYGKIESFEQFEGPHEHRVLYPVALVTTAKGDELVAKWNVKPAILKKEFAVSQLLLAHDIPTTVPIQFVSTIPLLLMERLSGQALSEDDMNVATAGEIGRLMYRIHAIAESEAVAAGVPAWEGSNFIDEMRRKFAERFSGAQPLLGETFDADELAAVFTALDERTTWNGKRGLDRRDMHAENWFRIANGQLAAIDHGNATVGDIAYDLVQIKNEFHQDPERIAAFRAMYGADQFDAATEPAVEAIVNLVHGLGILGWIQRQAVSQPDFEAEARTLIQRAVAQSHLAPDQPRA